MPLRGSGRAAFVPHGDDENPLLSSGHHVPCNVGQRAHRPVTGGLYIGKFQPCIVSREPFAVVDVEEVTRHWALSLFGCQPRCPNRRSRSEPDPNPNRDYPASRAARLSSPPNSAADGRSSPAHHTSSTVAAGLAGHLGPEHRGGRDPRSKSFRGGSCYTRIHEVRAVRPHVGERHGAGSRASPSRWARLGLRSITLDRPVPAPVRRLFRHAALQRSRCRSPTSCGTILNIPDGVTDRAEEVLD
jgi:hypothetical protein